MAFGLNNIKNWFFSSPGSTVQPSTPKKASSYTMPYQLPRIRTDIGFWRDAAKEAESAYYPFRVKMQQMYQDTIIDGHVFACMERRKDLVRLMDFKVCDSSGDTIESITDLLSAKWFMDFLDYTLDANAFGYSLIELNDIINSGFPNITTSKRANISPDRLNIAYIPYAIPGQNFTTGDIADWNIWIPTKNPIGTSKCGYGYLYSVARYEIFMRNNMNFNADYNEMFGAPIRVLKTSKSDPEERNLQEKALQQMGHSSYMILDGMADEELQLHVPYTKGQLNIYDNMEYRCQKIISKIILGHADAMDSVPGKLGASQGEDNPVYMSMMHKKMHDAAFAEAIVNNELLPRMRKFGFKIPNGAKFSFINNDEDELIRVRQNKSNKENANIYKAIYQAGGRPDWSYFIEKTGINVYEREDFKSCTGGDEDVREDNTEQEIQDEGREDSKVREGDEQ